MASDPRRRFSATAADYHRHRPDYPAALFDWLLAETALEPGAPVADIGCGTGIVSRALAARGLEVAGIDPNLEMLAFAREAGGGPRYQQGESTATGLADASVELVTAGQAFHWFELPGTLAELARVLRPDGACAAFWNLRAASALLDEYETLLRRHSTEYASLPKAEETIRRIRARGEVEAVREAEFPHRQVLDGEGFFGRVQSSSYVAHGVEDREAFAAALGDLFERHQDAGRVVFPYRTVALLWRMRRR